MELVKTKIEPSFIRRRDHVVAYYLNNWMWGMSSLFSTAGQMLIDAWMRIRVKELYLIVDWS